MPAHARTRCDVPDTASISTTSSISSASKPRSHRKVKETVSRHRFGAGLTALVAVLGISVGLVAPATAATKKPARVTAAHRPSAALVKAVHARQAKAAAAKRRQAAKVAAAKRFQAAHAAAARKALVTRVLEEAERHEGQPYTYGAAGPATFDCSGFVRYVYGRFGVSLPHSSYAQYGMVKHIPASQAQPGDLLFLSGLGHVAIYVGHGMMIDATRPGSTVQLRHPYGPFLVGRVQA